MPIDAVISMKAVKKKLRKLEKYAPNHPKEIYSFAKVLAESLEDKATPEQFSKTVQELLSRIKEKAMEKGSPIAAYIFTRAQVNCAIISSAIPYIAGYVCPNDFAERIKETYRSDSYDSTILRLLADSS